MIWRTTLSFVALVMASCAGAREETIQRETIPPPPSSSECPKNFVSLFDGFETGRLAPFWKPGGYGTGRYEEGAITFQSQIVRSGKVAAKIEVNRGDVRQTQEGEPDSERAELDSRKYPLLGLDLWYGFSMYLPDNFPIVDNRLVIGQWKQAEADRPLISQRFRSGVFSILLILETEKKEFILREVTTRKWFDFIYNIKFSKQNDGYVRVWVNGKRVVDFQGQTAWRAEQNRFYNKFGLYRDEWPDPMTVYFDNYAVGCSYDEVNPDRHIP